MRKLRIARGKLLGMLLIVIYFCFFAAETTNAAQWLKTYPGSFNSIQQTSDGGFIAAGYISSGGAGGDDFWVVKLNGDGSIAWQKACGGPGSDKASSIIQTSDGGYIVTGSTNSFGEGDYDVWILKLNSHGSLAWQNIYGGSKEDQAYSIQQTCDKGYIVTGSTTSFGTDGQAAWVLKLNPDGSVVWQKHIGSGKANEVIQSLDGGYAIATDSGVLKLNSDGSLGWQKNYSNSPIKSIKQTAEGEYAVVGNYSGAIGGTLVLKLAADGKVAWKKLYDITGCQSMNLTSDGGYILGTRFALPATAPTVDTIMKLNQDGTVAWLTSLESWSFAFNSARETFDGGYVAAVSGGSILKLNRSGNIPGCSLLNVSYCPNCPSVTIPDITEGDTDFKVMGTDTLPRSSSIISVETQVNETMTCFFSSSWTAPVEFHTKVTSITEDASGNMKFHTTTETLAGILGFYFEEPNLTTNEDGCYVSFSSDDGLTTMCFKGVAAISTNVLKSKADQIRLVATGDFSMNRDGIPYSGIVYIDAKGALKKNSSREIISTDLSGKILGGIDNTFIFNANFRVILTK